MKRLLIVIALIVVGLFLIKGEPKSQTASEQTVIDELEQTIIERMGQRIDSLCVGARLSSEFSEITQQP